jgi:hypothetical protein
MTPERLKKSFHFLEKVLTNWCQNITFYMYRYGDTLLSGFGVRLRPMAEIAGKGG